jgi:predicted dehydrogenase
MRRRDFLRNSAAAAAAGLSFPYFVPRHVLAGPGKPGANDRFKVGFIGCGGRARGALMTTEKLSDHADIIAVTDCFLPRIDDAAPNVAGGDKWVKYQDYRKMLEKEKLDAVFIPTTTHARVLAAITAMQAGCDVYAEKPFALTISEGRSLAKAVKKYKKVLQVGTQQRTIPINAWGSKLVRDGGIGKVKEVLAPNFIGPDRWKPLPAEEMPKGLDWDLWCNQTELRPYRKELQLSWANWWDYDGGGKSWGVTGWGTHAFDQVQCALGTDDTGPVEIWTEGADAEGNVKVVMKYASGTLLKADQPLRRKDDAGNTVFHDLGAIFVGEKATLEIRRGSLVCDHPELIKDAPPGYPAATAGEVVWHIQNFFDCCRSRKKPAANVEAAQRATTVCYLVNIVRDMGRKLKWDPKAEKFIGDDEANKQLSRPRRPGYELPKEFA